MASTKVSRRTAIVERPLFGDAAPVREPEAVVEVRVAPRVAPQAAEKPIDPGPIVQVLYLSDDLRSVSFSGHTHLWPAIANPGLAGCFLGWPEDGKAPPQMHRLTPTLWAKVWAQVLATYDRLARGDAYDRQKLGELFELMEPILDYIRLMEWEPKPE